MAARLIAAPGPVALWLGWLVALGHAKSAHYTGIACNADETAAKVQGVQGELCSLACVNGTCPTVGPTAATSGLPSCALRAASREYARYCVVTCRPSPSHQNGTNGECGTGACQTIQGTGICTWQHTLGTGSLLELVLDDANPKTTPWWQDPLSLVAVVMKALAASTIIGVVLAAYQHWQESDTVPCTGMCMKLSWNVCHQHDYLPPTPVAAPYDRSLIASFNEFECSEETTLPTATADADERLVAQLGSLGDGI